MSQQKNMTSDERAVDLRRIFKVLLKRIWIIVAVSIISGLAMFFYSSLVETPVYRATFSAYVNNSLTTETAVKTSSSDLNASKDLLYVYQAIITSRSVMNEAMVECDNAKVSQEYWDVRCSVSSKAPILWVYVDSTDPELARDLAFAVEKVAPDQVRTKVEGSSMKTIDAPRVYANPVSPNIPQSTAYGVMFGCFAAILFVVIMDLVHDKVQSSEELEGRYDLPVIGKIPDMHQTDSKTAERYVGNRRRGGAGQ